MKTTSTLVLGLGGVGGLVARQLRERLVGSPHADTVRFLLLDAPGPEGPPKTLAISGHPVMESIPLSMESLREILETRRNWAPYLPWLAPFDRGLLLDELRPYGTAGYRCLGRLALLRSAEVIDRALRQHLHALRQAAPASASDALLITGASGGLGSSILPDLTFFLLRLGLTMSRSACLILPPTAEAGRGRFQANTFATLCETFALKSRQANWENHFELLPSIEVKPQAWEPWQRCFLFQAGADERPPYEATAAQVADVLAIQLSPEIARHRHDAAQDLTALEFQPHALASRSGAGFSCCHGSALDPASLAEAPREPRPGEPTLGIDPFLLDEAVSMLLDTIDQDLANLRALLYQKRKKELADLHGDLAAREVALLRTVLEPDERDDSPGLKLEPQAVLRLPGAEKALRWLWAEVRKPTPAVTAAPPRNPPANLVPARQQVADLRELREDATYIWKDSSPAPATTSGSQRPRRRVWFPRLQRNMLWNLGQRFASAQSLLRTPEFHEALCRAFEEILLGWQRQQGDPDEELRAYPTLEAWFEQLEGDLKNVAQVFQASSPQPERRQFAWLFLPSKLPGDLNRKSVQERIKSIVKSTLQGDFQTFDSEDGQLRLYYEDLFRGPTEIRRLQEYRKAYQAETRKEMLHADYRFAEKGICPELCREDVKACYCGNPGCDEDIQSVSRSGTICPGCGEPIRSRCGNPDCRIVNLHELPEAQNRVCPGCGGVNRGAWWICCRHGKVDHYVPIDKATCPECIRRHHENPDNFFLSQVSRRPDIRGNRTCPHCEELTKKDPSFAAFRIPAELEPFVDHGVNGHDRPRFLELARRYKMQDDHRCPGCGTLLIPVDHRNKEKGNDQVC